MFHRSNSSPDILLGTHGNNRKVALDDHSLKGAIADPSAVTWGIGCRSWLN
jgi:hypothetical protein